MKNKAIDDNLKYLDLISESFLKNLKKCVFCEDTLIVAVSGGADSVALLFNLLKIKKFFKIKIIVAHVNHSLRGDESLRDEVFVKKICDEKKISFVCQKVDTKKFAFENGISIEEAARILRYDFLEKIRIKNKAKKIAVAHNKNDCVETIFLKLIRGSGIKALAGIKLINKNIIRPFINISREEIINYCIENNINYVNDSSNDELRYDRNKIRHKVIKVFREINNNFVNNMMRNCEIINDEDIFLDNLAFDFIKKNVIDENKIRIFDFKKLSIVLKRRVIKILLEKKLKIDSKKINFCKIKNIIDLLDKNNNKFIFIDKKNRAYRTKDEIVFNSNYEKKDFYYNIMIDKKIFIREIKKNIVVSRNENLNLDNNFYFKKNFFCKDIKRLLIRNFRVGDKIFFGQLNGHKKIKKILSEKKVSILDRNNITVLAYSDQNVIGILNFNIFSNLEYGDKFFIYIY
ncbi:MAG: tRNA lysidine(34) synthetase TilS [Clostridiales bacterium]|jgi:tRNA(Ile)-lysidine synthase|nr:tRNA lysidine(34) synthetase TilS [Clostridiales bacterium]